MGDHIFLLLLFAGFILFLFIVEVVSDKFLEFLTRLAAKYFGHLFTKNVIRLIIVSLFAIAALIWWSAFRRSPL